MIERFDRRTLARTLVPFSPQEVAAGRADRVLVDHDRVHLFADERIRALLAAPQDKPAENAVGVETAAPPAPLSVMAAEESLDPALREPAMAALFRERTVQIRGAVRLPGAYPVAVPTSLPTLIAVAGGLTAGADASSIEVTAATGTRRAVDLAEPGTARLSVAPGDAVRINPMAQALERHAVTILGEVRRPGSYDVLRGESLSSLIDRAGGLTESAYPAGAIFTRETERRREKRQFIQQARELERILSLRMEKGDGVKAENIALAQSVAAQLRDIDPLGRIVVEADPAVLRDRPELDILLESDDRIVIPKRPLTVTVAGEVQSPSGLQFISGKTAEDYIREAGGPTRNADPGRAFLVLPDGRAQPLAISSWNHTVTAVPPGSILVVPRDPEPFDFLEFTRNIGGILSHLAITAASVSVIAR